MTTMSLQKLVVRNPHTAPDSSSTSVSDAGGQTLRDGAKDDFKLEAQLESQKPPPKPQTFSAKIFSLFTVQEGEIYEAHPEQHPRWYQRMLDAGVEENGIKPVPLEHRTVTQYSNLFTVFFTCLLNLLP